MTNVTLPKDDDDHRGNVQGWLQVDKRAHQKMWQFGLKNPTGLAVLHFLTSRLTRGSNGVVMSYAAMASAMGIADRTAKTAIAALADARFIQVLKSGKSNVYIINSQVAWQGRRGARFAAFNAEIVLAETEQSQPVDDLIEEAKSLNVVPQLLAGERPFIDNDPIDPPDQGELSLP
ncbi:MULTISPECIES: replication/maintenance protein RepL [Bacillati]|uniref:replication/maintenance protein RepL n=2 Tax=Bacteria TaxID=2 RepID=UPI0035E27B32